MKRLNSPNDHLVQRLLASLGREAAVKACRSNLWFGIAAEIEVTTQARAADGAAGARRPARSDDRHSAVSFCENS